MKTSLCLLVIGVVIGVVNCRTGGDRRATIAEPTWPSEFEGLPLTPVGLTDIEAAFAQSFPGGIGVFESPGERQVILRQVNRATRRLHDSATCLRAAGFTIEGREISGGWMCYRARNDKQHLIVREQIVSADRDESWTEISDWFWHALVNRNAGPWTAITVIAPRERP